MARREESSAAGIWQRLLLRLYPARFRDRFGDEILGTWNRRRDEIQCTAGKWRAFRWTVSCIVDAAASSFAERLAVRKTSTLRPYPGDRKGTLMANSWQNLRYCVRSLRRQPGFCIAVILAIGLGVGANTAMFSVVNGVLLRQLPFEEPGELMIVYENDRLNNTLREGVSGPDYFDWLERQTAFDSMAAWRNASPTLTSQNQDPERLAMTHVSHSFFQTLGWDPMLGRTFSAEEDAPGGNKVAVLSHGLWLRRFAADRSVIGQDVLLDEVPHQVVGVMPPGFEFPGETDLWMPLRYSATSNPRGNHGLLVVARLKESASLQTAQAEMTRIMADLEREYPQDNQGRGATVDSLQFALLGTVETPLLILMGAVGLVLLIACTNVVNMLLSRGAAREREFCIRSAIGAGRRHILSRLLLESLLLAAAGGAAGLAMAFGAVRLLRLLEPAQLPRLESIEIDPAVLVFALAVTLVTGFVVGLLPGFRSTRTEPATVLNDASGQRSQAGGGHRLRRTLAAAQIAIAFMLVVGAGLLIQTLWNLQRVDLGFDPAGLAKASLNLPPGRYPSDFRDWPRAPEVKQFYEAILTRLRARAEVESAALAVNHPLNSGWTTRMAVEGGPQTLDEGLEEERIRPVSAGYFSTIGTPVVKGRDFGRFDHGQAPPVAIVNGAFERKYFPDEGAVGKHVEFWGARREIIGVAGDVRFMGLQGESRPAVYTHMEQQPFGTFDVVVRGRSDASGLIPLIQAEVAALDKTLAIFSAAPYEDVLSDSTASERFSMLVMAAFSGLALGLAVLGVYSVISYAVHQRRGEMGIRMSLGASRGKLLKLVLWQGLQLGLAGVVAGGLGAVMAGRFLETVLFEVESFDPWNLIGVALFLVAVSLAASLLPALRASRTDPLAALRSS